MTQEEKARAYDVLLTKAKQIYNKENDVLIIHTIEDLFPTIKENEDERVRKAIISGMKALQEKGKYTEFAHIPMDEVFTWLEKQGDKPQGKTAFEAIKKEKVDNQNCVKPADTVEPKIKNDIEIPFGAKDSELQEATYYIPKGFYAEIDDDKVVIKKSEKPAAWSKKDEKMFEYALNMIEWYSGKNEDKSRFVSDWFKSLKQRIGG